MLFYTETYVPLPAPNLFTFEKTINSANNYYGNSLYVTFLYPLLYSRNENAKNSGQLIFSILHIKKKFRLADEPITIRAQSHKMFSKFFCIII